MLGSRVTLQGSYEGNKLDNLVGTIIKAEDYNYLIAIDNWEGGHEGYGCDHPIFSKLRTNKNCWWVRKDNLLSISDPIPDKQALKNAVIDKIKYLETKFQNRKSNHVNG